MPISVVYSCPYVPAEWVAAHGLSPRRLIPRAAGNSSPVEVVFGLCTYARAFMHAVLTDAGASAVVVTTRCDPMRRVAELIERRRDVPLFLMNVPATWMSDSSRRLYRDELLRLGRFLVRLGGRHPSDDQLVRVMTDHATQRVRDSAHDSHAAGVPLALFGGPLLHEDIAVFGLVARAGGRIVLDATETGERGRPAPFDRGRLLQDPVGELVRAYFGSIQDASRRPNDPLYDAFGKEVERRGVRGIVFRRHTWCDPWHAELGRLREKISLPVLDWDGQDDLHTAPGRFAGRLDAFMEMLK